MSAISRTMLMLTVGHLALAMMPGRAMAQATPEEGTTSQARGNPILVTGKRQPRDEKGYDDVYEKDVSSVYAGKDEIEAYLGTSVGDLFKGMNGVYSGDSRNSGAIDPNIRGIQGEGRIPVSIDGTEQSTSVWMSSAGVANRNYVDPNMIGSIMVEKGPSMTPGVRTGMGGSVTVKTLEPADILRPGRSFGIELKADTSTNTVKPYDGWDQFWGKDYRDIPGLYLDIDGNLVFGGATPGPKVPPKSGDGSANFNLEDRAWRIAAAGRIGSTELLAAYSERTRGNFVAGKSGVEDYMTEELRGFMSPYESPDGSSDTPYPYIGRYFGPGMSLPNTSSDMRSMLFKASTDFGDGHALRASYMHTDHTYGETVPWWNDWMIRDVGLYETFPTEYPRSRLKQATYNLNYSLRPADNRWIDLNAGLWLTQSDGSRHQNGLLPVGVADWYAFRDFAWDNWSRCYAQDANPETCYHVSPVQPDKRPDPEGQLRLVPHALQLSDHQRWGANLNNTMQVTPDLTVMVSADYMAEDLDEWDASYNRSGTQNTHGVNYLGPRSGRRQQWNAEFQFSWRPVEWLQIEGGYRYSNYWSYDDKLAQERQLKTNTAFAIKAPVIGNRFQYQELFTDAEAAQHAQIIREIWQTEHDYWQEYLTEHMPEFYEMMGANPDEAVRLSQDENGLFYTQHGVREVIVPYNGSHAGYAETNPFGTGPGKIDPNEMIVNPQGQSGTFPRYLIHASQGNAVLGQPPADIWAMPEAQRSSGWAPQISVTAHVRDNVRVYARYAEFLRFPTIFEATQAQHGAAYAVGGTTSDPEHAYNIELGIVADLKAWVPSLSKFDARINYFNNRIENYIDRDINFNIVRFKEKRLSGIEFQSRIDTGKLFGNLGATWRLTQEMCDADHAAYMDPVFRTVPECVDGGFPHSFARTSVQPEFSINIDAGIRLLNNRLEIGGRAVYHSEANNSDDEALGDFAWTVNRPLYWQPILVFDGYANFQISTNFTLNFGITNITDKYYIDPIARVGMPAPGRTMRLGVAARF